MHLKILLDDNANNGANFFVINEGRENQLTPDKPLYGLDEDDIIEYAKDYDEWVTRQKIEYCQIEYEES